MVMNQKLLDEWNFPWNRGTVIGHENTHSRLPEIVLIFMRNSSLINDFIKEPNGFITGLYNGQLSSTHQRHK